MDGVVRRLPVKGVDASNDLIEIDGIFYLEAQGKDTLIRTKRKNRINQYSGFKSWPKNYRFRRSCVAIGNTLSI